MEAGPALTADPIPLSTLAARLRLGAAEHVSIVGGGGKTTTLHALADQLAGTKVVTTTTKMGHDQNWGRPVLLAPTDAELGRSLSEVMTGSAVMVWARIEGTKAVGVAPTDCDRWFGLRDVDHVLVEADGARRRPFKAPGPLEPVVPASTTMLLSVLGADALGRVIGDQCHRPLRVAALAGCQPYERLTPERAASVLLDGRGFVAARPPSARMAIIVTKVGEAVRSNVDRLVAALAADDRRGGIDIVTIAHSAQPAGDQPRSASTSARSAS